MEELPPNTYSESGRTQILPKKDLETNKEAVGKIEPITTGNN